MKPSFIGNLKLFLNYYLPCKIGGWIFFTTTQCIYLLTKFVSNYSNTVNFHKFTI